MADYSELKRLADEVNAAFPDKEDLWSMVCTPTVGLELIAEIDRLRDSHQQVCENYNKVSYASEERGKQIDQLKAENEALRNGAACVDDLSALVRQLVQRLRKAAPENDLPEKALDYLKRKGLQGSPLRAERNEALELAAQAIYESWADHPEYVPWVVGGNSLKQDEARRLAMSKDSSHE